MQDEKARRRRIALWLMALVWLSCAWFSSWALNPNNSTRMFAAAALVERSEATIDRFAPLTIDKAEFDGHVYTDKAPGMTLMAMPFMALTNQVRGENSNSVPIALYAPETEAFFQLRMKLSLLGTTALLVALAAGALFDLVVRVTSSIGAGLIAASGFAMGTPIWGWSTTLFGHAPVSALLVIATWAVWRGTEVPGRATWQAMLAGAALGWAVVIEPAAVLTGAPIGLWAVWRVRNWEAAVRWRMIAVAIAAGGIALVPLLGYNLVAFGTPFRLGYQGVVGFDGMQQGLFGLTYPKADVLFEILLGPRRGLIWVAPVMILAPIGLYRSMRGGGERDLYVLAVAVAVLAFLYNASYVYWDGGFSTGPRHAIPAMGFLAIGLAGFWANAIATERWITALLLAISIALNLAIASAEIMAPDTIGFPIWEAVLRDGVLRGHLRTVPDQFWGWSPWVGLALYLALAAMLAMGLALAVRRSSRPSL